jgi:fructose-1-phosphate kinase PfkB-like protein
MLALLGRHVVEHAGAVGIGLAQIFREIGIEAAVLLLVGDRQGEHFLLGEV